MVFLIHTELRCTVNHTSDLLRTVFDSRWNNAYVTIVKVKVTPLQAGVVQRLGRGIALLFHDRGTRKGVSGQQHAPATLYPRERLGTHFTGGWVGPIFGLDGQKISSPPDRPSRSQSLYRLSYPAQTCYICSKYEKSYYFSENGCAPVRRGKWWRDMLSWVLKKELSVTGLIRGFSAWRLGCVHLEFISLVGRLGKIPLSKITLRSPTSD